ncbi:MAG: hypothetical protein IJX08_03475 [Clostridia bacterium]|nr:hypothetical protein [Clostridia bacterium]
MKNQFFDLLKSLCEVFGPTGCEGRVADLIEKSLDGIPCKKDAVGNLIVHLEGKGKKILVTAPMDEAGYMITDIDDKGYVRFEKTGNADTGCFAGKRLTLGNEETTISAVGGVKVLHLAGGEAGDTPNADKVFAETGLSSEELKKQLDKGDFAALEGSLSTLPGGYLVGKALEARALCALLVEAIKELNKKDEKERNDLYFVFTVKEKAGMSSASAAAYTICPEEAYLLGFAPANDFDGVDEHLKGAKLGEGVVVALKDRRVLYFDSPLTEKALAVAKEQNIPAYGADMGACGDFSAGALHLVGAGIPCASLRLPCRNPETNRVIVKENDLENTLSLLCALI